MADLLIKLSVILVFCLKLTYCWESGDEEFVMTNEFNEHYIEAAEYIKARRQYLIVPGTKWCGDGNKSKDYDDLGVFTSTDKCCRKHDHCPDQIKAGQSKYNLTNPAVHSRLHCDCETEFFKCLKANNRAITSRVIGFLYFNVLGTQCYKMSHPLLGCKEYHKSLYIPGLKKKCKNYIFDMNGQVHYQWFDVPMF